MKSTSFPPVLYFTLFCRSSNKLSRTKAKTIFPITTTGPNFLWLHFKCSFLEKLGQFYYLVIWWLWRLIRWALKKLKLLQIWAALWFVLQQQWVNTNSLIIFFSKRFLQPPLLHSWSSQILSFKKWRKSPKNYFKKWSNKRLLQPEHHHFPKDRVRIWVLKSGGKVLKITQKNAQTKTKY